MEPRDGPEGERLFVDRETPERGSRAPFYVAYRDQEGSRRYGWVCGYCGSLDAAMDTMGRIECTDCGNRRKPTEWDAAHE